MGNREITFLLINQQEMGEKNGEGERIIQEKSINCFRYDQSGASQAVLVLKSPPADAGRLKRYRFDPWVGKIPWRRALQPTPVFLPGESHGQRNLAGYSP